MTAVMILTLLHVLTAFLLVSGIVGRGLALRDAARADEIHTVAALVRLGGRFETALVEAFNEAVRQVMERNAERLAALMAADRERASTRKDLEGAQ